MRGLWAGVEARAARCRRMTPDRSHKALPCVECGRVVEFPGKALKPRCSECYIERVRACSRAYRRRKGVISSCDAKAARRAEASARLARPHTAVLHHSAGVALPAADRPVDSDALRADVPALTQSRS